MTRIGSPSPHPSAGSPRPRFVLVLLAALVAACAGPRPEPADLLFRGGPVHTLEGLGTATALAVSDGRIAWVGDDDSADRWRGPDTQVIELEGRALTPGFADAHLHLGGVANWFADVDLVGTPSYAEVVALTAHRASVEPEGHWILGRGWDQNDWTDTRFPHHSELSAAVPDHPVLLRRIDGHALLANRAALAAAGIHRDTQAPSGGRILRDDEGAPTGVFIDDAMDLFADLVPQVPDDVRAHRTQQAIALLHTYGITSIHDAGTSAHTARLYGTLARQGDFPLRAHIMIRADDPVLGIVSNEWPTPDLTGQGLISVRAIKLSADGALGSRGAALLDDYSDEPGHRGLTRADQPAVLALARFALDKGWQLATHAIGDRANRLVLDAYEIALSEAPADADPRFRIEHAQILHPADIPRFAELGVIPSMQAQHLTSDMPWAEQRVGSQRLRGGYAWRSLIDAGSIIPGGSDAPVEVPDPLDAYHAAVTRQDMAGEPPGGWTSAQCMTRDEALRHLTSWPAYAAFDEDRLGTLAVGKLADLVVLSGDLLTLTDDALRDLRVDMTVFDGRVVYDRLRTADEAPDA